MSAFEVVAILLAGMAAGTINTIIGSGTLVTFPTLLFFGYPPVVANMSNAVGLVAGGVSGVYGYRRELASATTLLRRLVPSSMVGAAIGALLLLVLPATVFEVVVPVLIAFGVVLVLLGPRLQRRAARRQADAPPGRTASAGLGLCLSVAAAGVYGGYFSAAQGVILVGLLGAFLTVDLQVINGIKNVLGLTVNVVAAFVFVVVAGADIVWSVAALIAVGALLGGLLGARIARSLPSAVLRAVIVVIGVVAIAQMTVFA